MRAYTRQEISDITGIKLTDKNFRQRVPERLQNWHYECQWEQQRGGNIIITQRPTKPIDRLHEIMMRQFRMSVQIDPYRFAIYLHLLMTVENADKMPVEERKIQIWERYQESIHEDTLYSWTAQLEEADVLSTDVHDRHRWKAWREHGIMHRKFVGEEEKDEYNAYWERYRDLKAEYLHKHPNEEITDKALNNIVFKKLWEEFGFGYSKPIFTLVWNGINLGEETYNLVERLVLEIVEAGAAEESEATGEEVEEEFDWDEYYRQSLTEEPRF